MSPDPNPVSKGYTEDDVRRDVQAVLDQTVMHSHRHPGVWDPDNRPGLAGTRCVECAARERLHEWLAGAGRLLPEDTRTQWAIELFPAEENGGKPYIVQTENGTEEEARFVAAGGPGKIIRRWVGPWVPVPEEPKEDR